MRQIRHKLCPMHSLCLGKKGVFLRSFILAFSMYSAIPMPEMAWKEEDTCFVLCFFPLVGLVVGTVLYFAFKLMTYLSVPPLLRGAVLFTVPILVTGGIHIDGFLDTLDAKHSWREKEKRLEILKDPHIGAFAFVYGSTYVLLQTAALSGLEEESVKAYAASLILSRILSAISALFFPKANTTGSLYTLAKAQDFIVKWVLITELCFLVLLLLFRFGRRGIVCLFASALAFLYYRYMSKRLFGGITGDLAGYFLCICELSVLMALAFLFK